MKKYIKKEKKEVNSQKKKQKNPHNVLLGKRLKDEIDLRYKFHTDFIKDCTAHSNYANSPTGEEWIKPNQLSDIINGTAKLPPYRAEVFAKVLGVSQGFLLGYEDYPSEKAKEDAIFQNTISRWSDEDKERISTVKKIMSILSDRKYQFHFELVEDHETISPLTGKPYTVHDVIITKNMQHVLFTENGSRILDDATFFNWLCDITLPVCIKDGDYEEYYHLNDKIQILSSDHKLIELDTNSFMKMVYDIYDSINNTIQARCDFWFKYSDYDYKEAFRHDYDDYDV